MWTDGYTNGTDLGWVDGSGQVAVFTPYDPTKTIVDMTAEAWTVPCPACYLRAAAIGDVVCAAGQGTDSYDVIVVLNTGEQHRLPGPPTGAQPVAVRAVDGLFEVIYVISDRQYRKALFDTTLKLVSSFTTETLPPQYPGFGSQGILDYRADGTPISCDALRTRIVRVPVSGVLTDCVLGYPQSSGPATQRFTVAQNYIGAEIFVFNEAMQRMLVAAPSTASPVNPRIVVTDDGLRGLVNLATNPPTVPIPLSAWVPYTAPPVPVVPLPAFPKTDRRVSVLVMDDPNLLAPRLAVPGFYPIFPVGVWGTVDRDAAADLDRSRLDAATRALLFCGYNDQSPPETKNLKPGDLALLQAYPKPGESAAAFDRRLRADLEIVKDFRIVLLVAGFRGAKGDGTYHRTLESVRLGFRSSWQVCLEGKAEGMVIYNWDKSYTQYSDDGKAVIRYVPDGTGVIPELIEDMQAMRAASADWKHFPAPAPPELEDDDMLIIPKSVMQPYHEWPTTHVVVREPNTNARWLRVDDRGELSWEDKSLLNEDPTNEPTHDQKILWSGYALEWTDGQTKAIANRGGLMREFKVALDR